jgi:hypothetical protein
MEPIRTVATTLALVAAAAAGPARAAGTVEVRFQDPGSYADAGWTTSERESNLRALAEHMQRWQPLLPDGQLLQVEVLDVDLAGEQGRWWTRPEIRVMTGRTDAPRMQLRWTLKAGERVVSGGQDRLADFGYLWTSSRLVGSNESLAYDRRMLDDWLRTRVLGRDAAPAPRP